MTRKKITRGLSNYYAWHAVSRGGASLLLHKSSPFFMMYRPLSPAGRRAALQGKNARIFGPRVPAG